METNDSATGRAARLRELVPVTRRAGAPAVNVLSTYVLPGVDWDYYQVFYRNLDLANNWPVGMSAHAAWEYEDGFRTMHLWDENLNADHYFANVGMKAVTDTIRALGPAKSPTGATDVQPLRLEVKEWTLGLYASAFSGIDADRDGAAIDELGTRPAMVEFELDASPASVIAALGLKSRIPKELIALLVADHGGGSRIMQIWTSEEVARAALDSIVFPAFAQAGIDCDVTADEAIFELRRLVIADGAAEAFGHPPAIEL